MAKGDMTIIDVYVDRATGNALDEFDSKFELGVPRQKRWFIKESDASYRERVRGALVSYFDNMKERMTK